jgi:hypothetical protein
VIGRLQQFWRRVGGRKDDAPRLSGYLDAGAIVSIRPAPAERDWMDRTNERFAYRCLPLTIANAHGWELLLPNGFSAVWNGGAGLDAITVTNDPGADSPAESHFGHGILTMRVPCLFRTGPGVDLMVQGPINRPKDGIAALTAIIETDWAPYTFTMNWRFTRPDLAIRFEAGEPYCHIFPTRRGEVEAVAPRLHMMSEDPELERQHAAWRAARVKFNADLKVPGSAAQAQRWQKLYHRGLDPDARPGSDGHRTRIRAQPFVW